MQECIDLISSCLAGTQDPPSLWKGYSETELLAAAQEYTTKVLDRFHAEGIPIEIYSTGNEIRLGMLWPYGGNKTSVNLPNLVKIQNAIVRGIRASKMTPLPKIMVHVDGMAQPKKMHTFWQGLFGNGFPRSSVDIAGGTWYPFYSILETQAAAIESLSWMATTYKLPIVIVSWLQWLLVCITN